MNKNIKLKLGDIISNENVVETTVNGLAGKSIKEFENLHPSYKVLKLERPQTIYEFKEILGEKEKEYLSAVIRPFKGRVDYIKKFDITGKEFICVCLKNDEDIDFPLFKKGTMYRGMELSKEYTLKELGLE